MEKIGLIGGLSWRSTVEYYSRINTQVNLHYGDNTNPPLRIININQREMHDLQRNNDWDTIAKIIISASKELQAVGVECLAICASTPHKVVDQVQDVVTIPILHIADAVGSFLRERKIDFVGLLGSRFTMSEDFIKLRLFTKNKIKTIVPNLDAQNEIQKRLYEELSIGVFNSQTRQFFVKEIENMAIQGAQAVILGCTEFPILLEKEHCSIPLIDSIDIHCDAIVKYILG
ncbi:aspartate/glutamate racemase family protein [Desulfoplanes formicivorans]|uniref:Aspartate racemase n=1 Tax=Desulfoplanes formicivorans TaxID=1592317 RepID=A0A194AD96_9BACT|nr:amino acid racemase [Desulfoplanes formicivorans]GAU07328.1 aspartate racemase [Desulfoplanes formicivorans]